MRRSILIVAAVLGASAALAQGTSAPSNVNECTLLQDPVELRNCILRFEGNRTPPPPVAESTASDPAEAGAPAGGQAGRAAARGKARAEPTQPKANDTLISIEQIQVPHARHRRDP